MTKIPHDQLAREWAHLLSEAPASAAATLASAARQHGEDLASHFYEHMLGDAAASQFLSHDQVRTRLHASMQRWIASVFSATAHDDLSPLIAQQVQIGEVHARIGVPMHLVLRGARRLKERLRELLQQHRAPDADAAGRLGSGVVDTAMEIMSQAYSTSHDRQSRAEEAYRLFSVSQQVGAEKERQRAALLAWENQLMFEQAVGTDAAHLPRVNASEFGLWFRHKGTHAFQGSTEAELILDAMDRIDEVLLPMFALEGPPSADVRIARLREVREATKSMAYHLDRLFEQNSEIEAGRDALTRLFNRKYLPVVLSKEVHFARHRKSSFALVVVDIDHFKQVNDTYGHEAGDMVLQQLAVLLTNLSRGGDYVFRLGGEEFLLLLVDIQPSGASLVAEKLRRHVEAETFRLPLDRTLKMTVSVGLAVHDGHPDYQRTLRLADEALYQAKHQGRNRVVQLPA